MKRKFVRLSYDIEPDMPIFTNNPKNKIESIDSFDKGATWNSYCLTLFNHNGTHIDAPNHFDHSGKKICDYHLEDFIFHNVHLVDIPKQAGEAITAADLEPIGQEAADCDLLMIRTGFHKRRQEPDYVKNNPWISQEAARFIRTKFKKLKALGMDIISIASFPNIDSGGESHQILLKKGPYKSDPIVIIEDMNLGPVPKKIKRLYAVPLFVKHVDSMPCTVIAEVGS